MNRFAKIAAAAAIALGAGTISANAACDGDASTETVLGAGSGALVGGLASHSIVGAAVGGVAGGFAGNAIARNQDCNDHDRARYRHREHESYYIDRHGRRHYR